MQNDMAEIAQGNYLPQELEDLLKDAYSYESREKHEKAHLECRYLGTVPRGIRLYDVYIDSEKNAWYTVRFMTREGPVSEFEGVFGHPERKWWEKNEWKQEDSYSTAVHGADADHVHALLSDIRSLLGGAEHKKE